MTQPGRDAKSCLLARVQWEWSAFQDTIESLTEADHLLTGVVGDWSVRDLLGPYHLLGRGSLEGYPHHLGG